MTRNKVRISRHVSLTPVLALHPPTPRGQGDAQRAGPQSRDEAHLPSRLPRARLSKAHRWQPLVVLLCVGACARGRPIQDALVDARARAQSGQYSVRVRRGRAQGLATLQAGERACRHGGFSRRSEAVSLLHRDVWIAQ